MAKRRKNNTGTVRHRADGRWEGRVVTGYDDNGNPKTKNVLAKTKTECLEMLKKLQEEFAPPIRKCSPGMPFADWMDFWYQTYCKPQLRLNTQLGYEDRIYKHIIPSLGKIPLDKLTQNDLQQFYAKLKTQGRLIRVEQFGPGLSNRDGPGVPRQLPFRPAKGGGGKLNSHQSRHRLQAAAEEK